MTMSNKLACILRRDSRTCGIHLGGCGKTVDKKKQDDVNHIIPQCFFRQRESNLGRLHYNRNWNYQPTHKQCNHARKGQIWGFPLFRCRRHWIQIERKNSGAFCQYVYFRKEQSVLAQEFLLVSDCAFVAASPPGMDITFVGSMGIAKHGTTGPGCEGHSFPRLSPSEVQEFNRLEFERIMKSPNNPSGHSLIIEKYNSRMMKMWISYETLDPNSGDGDNER